jgi:MoaA/NifB/PqqE/SkfB family radical SAM enzyme
VPYISMVTNGNLLENQDIIDLSTAGLNEFIFSMHGVFKETYEDLMDKGIYEKFHAVLSYITEEKKKNPKLRLRINYTFNADNFYELKEFFKVYDKYSIDIIQLRPIDKIGETTYNNFSLKTIENDYKEMISLLKKESSKRGITFLSPRTISRNEEESLKVKTENDSSYLIPYTYCYVSPKYFWKDDFDWKTETFADWQKRNSWNNVLFKNIFLSKKDLEKPNRNMLNYSVEIN